jgi:hypothetical protein
MVNTLSPNMVAVDCEFMLGSQEDTCATFIIDCIANTAETGSESAALSDDHQSRSR